MALKTRIATVLLGTAQLAAMAVAAVLLPGDAYAALSDGAMTAATYWQELAIATAVIAAVLYLDTASWSVMTAKTRRR